MTNLLVEPSQDGSCFRLNDCTLHMLARDCFDGIHRTPHRALPILDVVREPASQKIGAQEAGRWFKLWASGAKKVPGIGVGSRGRRVAAPGSNKHRRLD